MTEIAGPDRTYGRRAARLIQQAMRNGMPGGARVGAYVGFRGQIKELWIGE